MNSQYYFPSQKNLMNSSFLRGPTILSLIHDIFTRYRVVKGFDLLKLFASSFSKSHAADMLHLVFANLVRDFIQLC